MKDKAVDFFKSLTSKQIILGIALAVLIIYVIRLNSLKNILIIIPALLIAITVHEFGHAFMARKYGDETSKGRITLNPFKHIDLIGLLSLFVCGIGWGKPVEIDPNNFKKNKIPVDRIEAIVSLAGPSANFITAILLAIILKLFIVLGIIGLTTNYLLFQIILILSIKLSQLIMFPSKVILQDIK